MIRPARDAEARACRMALQRVAGEQVAERLLEALDLVGVEGAQAIVLVR